MEKNGEYFLDLYKCSICGSTDVKLWNSAEFPDLLICASCAEERQATRYYTLIEGFKKKPVESGFYRLVVVPQVNEDGSPKRAAFPRWAIDDDGAIPVASDLNGGGYGKDPVMTHILMLDLDGIMVPGRDYLVIYALTSVFPAIPWSLNDTRVRSGKSRFYEPGRPAPAVLFDWWSRLPTHKEKEALTTLIGTPVFF